LGRFWRIFKSSEVSISYFQKSADTRMLDLGSAGCLEFERRGHHDGANT
jgi:hypothetical protein